MEGIISNIQRFSMHDGPGIRSTVFLKGCPLRCIWCHNPETYQFGLELRYKKAVCIHCMNCVAACPTHALQNIDGEIQYEEALCTLCGDCVHQCPTSAIAFSGQMMAVDMVLEEVLRDKGMYEKTGGGVTLSGGEASAQYEFSIQLLNALEAQGIHTALDTCGYCESERFESLVKSADLILFDLKHSDPMIHKQLTGVDNRLILKNLARCESLHTPVEIRIPVIPQHNDDDETLEKIAEIIKNHKCISSIIMLGYHPLGQSKIYSFDQTGADLNITSPSRNRMIKLANKMQAMTGIKTTSR